MSVHTYVVAVAAAQSCGLFIAFPPLSKRVSYLCERESTRESASVYVVVYVCVCVCMCVSVCGLRCSKLRALPRSPSSL